MNRKNNFRGLISDVVFLLALLTSPLVMGQTDSVVDLSQYFGTFRGAFEAYDTRTGLTIRHNPALCAQRFSPASTFKIPNSLIGLETGVIPDQHYVIPWDGVKRTFTSWNRDHDLASAIANSVVPYYQELARRVGKARMQHYLDTLGYGNRTIGEAVDRFWLDGSLQISPDEQVAFLRRLRDDRVPFSQRSIGIVKEIVKQDSSAGWTLRAKTGYAAEDSLHAVGWYVGWVERADRAVVFALCIPTDRRPVDGDLLFEQRKPIAMAILKAIGALD